MPRPCQTWKPLTEEGLDFLEQSPADGVSRDACAYCWGGHAVDTSCSCGTAETPCHAATTDGGGAAADAMATAAAAATLHGFQQVDAQLAELCDELCCITRDYHDSLVRCMHTVLKQPLKLRRGHAQRAKQPKVTDLLSQFSAAIRSIDAPLETASVEDGFLEMPVSMEKAYTGIDASHELGKSSESWGSEPIRKPPGKSQGGRKTTPFRKSATEWSLESRAQAELAWTDELSGDAPTANVRRQSIFSEFWQQSEAEHEDSAITRLWKWMSKNHVIEKVLGLVIISNAAFVGAQVQYAALFPGESTPAAFGIAQNAYFAFFSAELLLRLAVSRSDFFMSEDWAWNMFDAAVRAAGLVRHVRIVRILRPLRVLFHSILCTLSSLLWAMVLLTLIMYTFSVTFVLAATDAVGTGLLGAQDEAELLTYWGSVSRSSYTLFMAVSGGISWEVVVIPLDAVHWCYGWLFVLYIILVVFAVLNLVNGVFCQSAIEGAEHGKDEIIAEQMRQSAQRKQDLRHLFHDINGWDSDVLTAQEFATYLQDDRVSSYFAALNLNIEDAYDFFRLLDTADTDAVDVDEFVESVLRLGKHARAIDIAIMMKASLGKTNETCNGHCQTTRR